MNDMLKQALEKVRAMSVKEFQRIEKEKGLVLREKEYSPNCDDDFIVILNLECLNLFSENDFKHLYYKNYRYLCNSRTYDLLKSKRNKEKTNYAEYCTTDNLSGVYIGLGVA